MIRKNNPKRAETTVMMFLIKLILAVIAIIVILAFMAGIWKAIFPSQDTASLKSFETLYSLMNSKMASNMPYDSDVFTLYLYPDYRVIYFPSTDFYTCAKSTDKYPKPGSCATGKSCLCLYSADPDLSSKDKNVVECKTFNTDIPIAAFQLNNDACKKVDSDAYKALIVAEQITPTPGQQNKKIYVWLSTPDNQAMDAKLKAPACPNNVKNPKDICNGQKQDAILNSPSWYKEVLTTCKAQSPPKVTLSATCAFNANLNTCSMVCSSSEIQCGNTLKSCSDYEYYADDGSMSASYMIKNSSAEWACSNDKDVCNVNPKGCRTSPETYYYCVRGGSLCSDDFNKLDPKMVTKCNIKREFSIDYGFLVSYDQSVVGCDQYFEMTSFSSPTQVYAYNPDVSHDMFRANTQLLSKCGFFANPTGRVVMLTSTDSDCQKAITDNLLPLQYCLANP